MKGILKRIGVLLLILTVFTKSWGAHVYAAEDTENTVLEVEVTDTEVISEDNTETSTNDESGDTEETEDNTDEEIPDTEEEPEGSTESLEDIEQSVEETEKYDNNTEEEQSIGEWIKENIPEDYSELLSRPQEWWGSLSSNQKMVAEIFAEPVVVDNNHYKEQPLDEVISIIESGEVNISDFFEQTIFQKITMKQLKELKNNGWNLEQLTDTVMAICGYEGYELPEEDRLLEIAIMASGFSPFMLLYEATVGEEVAHMNLTATGYTDGKGNPFWWIKNGGENAYCLSHGASCSRTYNYGNFKKVTGEAAYLIQNYGQSSTKEGYMCIQMAVWQLEAGTALDAVYNSAYAYYVKGGVDESNADAWAKTVVSFVKLAKGKSGTIWVAEGPPGSQDVGKTTEFTTTTYTGGSTGGDTEEPELVEPEFATIEDSITVTYEIKVRKADWQTNVGLAGCVVDIYENGSKVDTVTTNASGQASYETSKSASFSAEYCTNYDELTAEQQAAITCFTSLSEAQADIEAQKSDFENTAYTFSCKEITAPTGYVWQANEKSASVKGNGSKTLNITNERTLGAVELVKYDTESESAEIQGEATLEGAVYGIYAAENIVHQDKKTGVIYKKDQLIATGTIGKSPKRNASGYILNTDGSRHIERPGGTIAYVDTPGKTMFGDLELGKYYIKEITPAEGYMLDETVYDVTFTYKNQNTKIETRNETAADAENTLTMDDNSGSKTVYSGDYVIKQGIQFVKTSDNTYQTELEPIAGAGFSVYLISDLSGVKDGTLTPVNGTWGADDIMTFYDYDFTNEQKAVLYKRNNETWTDGDTKWLTSLGGNKYEVAEMFTDADGRIETPELPYGTYVIVETTTPENHVCAKPFIAYVTQDGGVLYTDATKQTVEKTYTTADAIRYGDRTATKDREGRVLQKQRIINNTITKTYLRVVKADEEFLIQPGSYIKPEEVVRGTVLKEGAQYRVRCLTLDVSEESIKALNWKYDADGYLSYYDAYTKAMLGTEDSPFTTFFLKANGKILDCYITLPQELPVGSYELIEITAPEGYVVNGSEQTVQDTSTGRVNGYEIVDTPKAKVVFTIGNGSVYPDGQMGTNKYALQDSYGNLTVTVLQKNQEQKGIIQIYKHGEQISVIERDTQTLLDKLPDTPLRDIMNKAEAAHQDVVFKYEDAPVDGAQFNIIAAEDIYTQELDADLFGQYNVNTDDYLLYKKGDVVATITTDRNGWGYASGLYIGKYKIIETVAGNGFVLNTTETEFEITPQEQTVNFDIHSADYKNERQKLEITVTKTDAESDEPLAGAVYGLYAAEDLYTHIEYDATADKWIVRDTPEILIVKDTLVATCITEASGKAVFDEDLPLGKYYVRELEAPLGYVNGVADVFIDASYNDEKGGHTVEKQSHKAVFANYPTKLQVSKKDITNQKELPGATLEIYNEEGNLVVSWVSTEKPHFIKALPVGKYTLVEKMAPPGYDYAKSIEFEIKDTVELHKVEMFDDILGVDVEKSTISSTKPGAVFQYTIDRVKNWTDKSLENFTLTDTLPSNVRIRRLWTGAFNEPLEYSIEYKTNHNQEWRIWRAKADTSLNEELQLPEELKLGEYVSAFRFCFGTVPGGFENTIAPKYEVAVTKNAAGVLHNDIELTAILDGKPLSDKDETDTPVEIFEPVTPRNPQPEETQPEKEVPQIVEVPPVVADTGDSTKLFGWCIALCSAGVAMIVLSRWIKGKNSQ